MSVSSVIPISLDHIKANYHYQLALEHSKKTGVQALPPLEGGMRYGYAYTRVSTIMQAQDGFSLQHQERQLYEYCKLNKIQLLHTYVDDGVSGGTLDRPDLTKMLNALQPGYVVVCSSVSRLSRNTDQLSTIYKTINAKQCELILLDVGMDTSTPIGQAIMKILGVFAELERNQLGERISNVMNDMSRNGTLKKKPTYGWRRVNGELEEIGSEQAVIQYIRGLTINNPYITNASIVRELTSNKFYNRKGNPFDASTIKSIREHNNMR
jgi:site-specific DNA recombinase